MTIERNETDYEQPHATSPPDHVLTELQLHGYRPFQNEPDARPLPEARIVAAAVADIFDALIASLRETRLEPELERLTAEGVTLIERRSSMEYFRDQAADHATPDHTGIRAAARW